MSLGAVVVGAAIIVSACTDIANPPPNILQPEVAGHWASETNVSTGRLISLDSGQTLLVPVSDARLLFANIGAQTTSTLVIGGHEPNGRTWFAIVNPDPSVRLPGSGEPCYGAGRLNVYDEVRVWLFAPRLLRPVPRLTSASASPRWRPCRRHSLTTHRGTDRDSAFVSIPRAESRAGAIELAPEWRALRRLRSGTAVTRAHHIQVSRGA